MRFAILALLLTGCGAFYGQQWAKHEVCVQLCDSQTKEQTAAMAPDSKSCLCYNTKESWIVTCEPDCKTLLRWEKRP